jgi:outer membrane protein
MRNLMYITGLCLLLLLPLTGTAQSKIAWFNSQAVMDKLPEAQDAQKQIDNVVAQWQSELAKMQNDWQKKYEEYDKKKLILTAENRIQSERELQDLDKKIADYRSKKFGQNGELFTKQNDLMKPIQNKIFKVLQDIAKDKDYDYIFDKSGEILLMYSNDKFDLTADVLDRMVHFENK